MLRGCRMRIVATQFQYASCMSYECSGLPGSLCFVDVIWVLWPPSLLMVHGCHMSIVATQVPYASLLSFEYIGLPGYLFFTDVIYV